ncbi:MAG: GNAT family N-acetyltransferase, partial [Methanomicrobiales archaeon]|nr:GNAT family N-acetyltransferase [Methanomicrobiales archaeon]
MSAIPQKVSAQPAPVIRRARLTDVPGILAIERTSFIEPWDPDTISQSIDWFPTTCFVAEYRGEIVGFLIGSPQPVEGGFYGHIANLAVIERCRK